MIKNKAGFTLVELLGVVVILGILMGVAIPNISRVMQKQKSKIYVEDAKRLATQTITTFNKDNTLHKTPGTCFSLGYLDNGDFVEGPNGGIYLKDLSYVYYAGKNSENNDLYYVTLIECVDCKEGETYSNYNNKELRGVSKSEYHDMINSEDLKTLIKSGSDLYTGGIDGDDNCTTQYVSKTTSHSSSDTPSGSTIVSSASEFQYDEVSCRLLNDDDNIYEYEAGMTWAEYFSSDYFYTARTRRDYYIEPEFFSGMNSVLYFRSGCSPSSASGCTDTPVNKNDKIKPRSEGFYQFGNYNC